LKKTRNDGPPQTASQADQLATTVVTAGGSQLNSNNNILFVFSSTCLPCIVNMKLRYIFHHPPPETNVTLQKTAAKITLFSCCGESLLVLRIFSLFKVSFHFQNNVHGRS
jgi:hypothetical protein